MLSSRNNFIRSLNYYAGNRTCFSSSSCNFKKDTGREAILLNKLLAAKSNKKKFYPENKHSKNLQSVISDPKTQRRTPMRVSVLNKLFMTNITDILATGEVSESLSGRGMEIVNVSVNKDYHLTKVYWIAKSRDDEIWLEDFLPKIAPSLRHELSQLYLMGSVPKIQFIFYKNSSQLASLDDLLNSCDKGPEDDSTLSESSSDDIPPMSNNVYGLQYNDIVSKIMTSISKSRALHRAKSASKNFSKESSNCVDLSTTYSQKESIRKFFLLKKLKQEKYKNTDVSDRE